MQVGIIHVVHGKRLEAFKQLMEQRVTEAPDGEGTEYPVYPVDMDSVYRARVFDIGQTLYREIGIPREDKEGRKTWFKRNYQFFGAPVGLFCFIDRRCGAAQWSDLGMYLQTAMLLLREAGLDSCPQECWALYHRTVSGFLDISTGHMLFCGMSTVILITRHL